MLFLKSPARAWEKNDNLSLLKPSAKKPRTRVGEKQNGNNFRFERKKASRARGINVGFKSNIMLFLKSLACAWNKLTN
jgi:hypothetical protein